MSDAEMKAIAGFLLECEEAVCEQGSPEALTLHRNRLYQVIERLMKATFEASDQGLRVLLATMEKKARTLKQQIEERLAVRN